jgi:amidase
VLYAGVAAFVDGLARRCDHTLTPDDLSPEIWDLVGRGRRRTATDYLGAVHTLQDVSRHVARFYVDHDLWLTPTLCLPPLPLGSFDPHPDDLRYGLKRSSAYVAFTSLANITGQPAMSVPLYWNDAGLPIGTHFTGRFGDEGTLFCLAAQLETARPWVNRRPPVSA